MGRLAWFLVVVVCLLQQVSTDGNSDWSQPARADRQPAAIAAATVCASMLHPAGEP